MHKPFQKLHWQLALLFAVVTTAVSMTINIGSAVITLLKSPSSVEIIAKVETQLAQIEPHIAHSLSQTPIDTSALTQQIDGLLDLGDQINRSYEEIETQFISTVNYVAILKSNGDVVVSTAQFNDYHPAVPSEELAKTLKGTASTSIDPITQDTTIFYPIQEGPKSLGVIQIEIFIPTPDSLPISTIAAFHLQDLPGTILVSSLLGTVFGYLATQNLVRRLNTIATTSRQWAQGNFARRVKDRRNDEISNLGQHLNHMAGDLEQLVQTRSQLAALEERGHIARDLHDTVKQKVFATHMQLSAAELALRAQPQKTPEMIEHAIALNRQTQTDLTEIIHALRPAALHNLGLVEAVRAYTGEWSRRTGVAVDIGVQNETRLPLLLEDTLYRLIQEALANIEKHAQASQISIRFEWQPEIFQTTITDDGMGFTPQAVTNGSGLENMRARIEDQHGEFFVDSQPGEGTALTLRIPRKD